MTTKKNTGIIAKILIIGSSDLESVDYAYNNKDNIMINRLDNVINTKLPCKQFTLDTTNSKKLYKICKTCNLDDISHEIGYEFTPHNPAMFQLVEGQLVKADTDVDANEIVYKSEYSDFWREKRQVFEQFIKIKGYTPDQLSKLNIIYETCDPLYINNKLFIPALAKINAVIAKSLGIKSISPGKHHLFNMPIAEIPMQTRKNYYDMIVDCNAGMLWLLAPNNINVIFSLLRLGGIFAHMYNSTDNIRRLVFNDFISTVLTFRLGMPKLSSEQRKALNNYNKMLINYPFEYRDSGILIKVDEKPSS